MELSLMTTYSTAIFLKELYIYIFLTNIFQYMHIKFYIDQIIGIRVFFIPL